MTYLTLEPTRTISRLHEDMARALRSLYEPAEEASRGVGVFTPAVDIVELEQEVLLLADLPGVEPGHVDVSVEDRTLTLAGERHPYNDLKDPQAFRTERPSGRFTRTFILPTTVDTGRIHAEFNHGVLKVVLPKAEHVRARKIQIQTS